MAKNNTCFVGKTSIHAEITASYSRCDLGKRCVNKTTDNKVLRKYTLVSDISNKKVIGWTLYEKGGMNAEIMVEFIDENITGKYKKHLIIMDNGGAYKSQKVKDIVKETNNGLLYSFHYRSKTNAIESWFNQFKYYFQLNCSGAITYSQLKVKVKDAIKSIQKSSYSNYMKCAYIDKEIRKYHPKKSTRRRKPKEYIY